MAKKYDRTKYPEPKRIKIGRTKTVLDFDGSTPLHGLAWDKGTGLYYYAFFKQEKDFKAGRKTKKDYSFGFHYDDAVIKYKIFMQDNQEFFITTPEAVEVEQNITKPLSEKDKIWFKKFYGDIGLDEEVPDAIKFKAENLTMNQVGNGTIISQIKTNKKYALHFIKQLIADEEIKIEVIRMLKLNDLLPTDYKILPIQTISDYYYNTNPCSIKERRQCKRTLEQFMEIIKKKNLNDITEDDIHYYKDYLMNEFEKENRSTTWLNGRFTRVKTVLKYYNTNKKANGEKELVKEVLELCQILSKVRSKIKEPAKSFDSTTLATIFNKAVKSNDDELLLIFLLMLNCGYYPTDIRNLEKSMIKKKDNLTYILYNRKKTGEQFKRVNCLWTITAKLLDKQLNKNSNSPYVFTSAAGTKFAESTLGKRFKKFFEPAKGKKITHSDKSKVEAKHFRDTVATTLAFVVKNTNIMKVTLGHSINSQDEFWKYIDSRPEQQQEAANIIYKEFKTVLDKL